MLITREEILMGRDNGFPLNNILEANLRALLIALNKFRNIYGKPMVVSSGYRPGKYNANAGGLKNSNHKILLACDFKDADSSIDSYCIANLEVLSECGLYLEHPKWTNRWCHLQIARPSSGKRIFIPSNEEPSSEKLDELFISLQV